MASIHVAASQTSTRLTRPSTIVRGQRATLQVESSRSPLYRLRMRWQRMGIKHRPKYRLVVIDSKRQVKSGAYLDILGYYDPMREKAEFSAPLIYSWLIKGALPTQSAQLMLMKANILNTKGELMDLEYAAQMSSKVDSPELTRIDYNESKEWSMVDKETIDQALELEKERHGRDYVRPISIN